MAVVEVAHAAEGAPEGASEGAHAHAAHGGLVCPRGRAEVHGVCGEEEEEEEEEAVRQVTIKYKWGIIRAYHTASTGRGVGRTR